MATTKTRKRKIVYCNRGTIRGQGLTLAEAKASVEKEVDVVLEGSYEPAIVRHGDWTAIVYRDPHGWSYRIQGPGFPDDPEGITTVWSTCSMGQMTRDEAIQKSASHLIGLDGRNYRTDADFPDWFTSREGRSNILSNHRFYRAYAWAKSNKPDGRDNDAAWNEWACWHSRDEQFC